jgi:hypothetical protein
MISKPAHGWDSRQDLTANHRRTPTEHPPNRKWTHSLMLQVLLSYAKALEHPSSKLKRKPRICLCEELSLVWWPATVERPWPCLSKMNMHSLVEVAGDREAVVCVISGCEIIHKGASSHSCRGVRLADLIPDAPPECWSR